LHFVRRHRFILPQTPMFSHNSRLRPFHHPSNEEAVAVKMLREQLRLTVKMLADNARLP
jgi:hypothetical protein